MVEEWWCSATVEGWSSYVLAQKLNKNRGLWESQKIKFLDDQLQGAMNRMLVEGVSLSLHKVWRSLIICGIRHPSAPAPCRETSNSHCHLTSRFCLKSKSTKPSHSSFLQFCSNFHSQVLSHSLFFPIISYSQISPDNQSLVLRLQFITVRAVCLYRETLNFM